MEYRNGNELEGRRGEARDRESAREGDRDGDSERRGKRERAHAKRGGATRVEQERRQAERLRGCRKTEDGSGVYMSIVLCSQLLHACTHILLLRVMIDDASEAQA